MQTFCPISPYLIHRVLAWIKCLLYCKRLSNMDASAGMILETFQNQQNKFFMKKSFEKFIEHGEKKKTRMYRANNAKDKWYTKKPL